MLLDSGAIAGCLIVLFALIPVALAQNPPPVSSDSDITTINSPVDGNITITYKSPPVGTCTTVFSSQIQYTGYVTLPPFTLSVVQQNYSVNTFFWFIEARTSPETAPLTVYLNGGPGSSSMVGLFQEAGPCEVVEIAEGRIGTQAREWGWDRSSNILFIDQPNQVGFSYDTPTNASLNLLTSAVSMPPTTKPADIPEYAFLNGSLPSGDSNSTANTTEIAAQTTWHMLQGFLAAFPQYNPGSQENGTSTNSTTVGLNLFVESYGGKYGPAFASFFESQNALREQGVLPTNSTLAIDLVSLGIINGCVDDLIQGPFYPRFAYNNTYSIQAISLVDEQTAANAFLASNGCQQLIQSCRAEESSRDPNNDGDIGAVSDKCSQAESSCASTVINIYGNSGRSYYDITQATLDPFPPNTFLEYLNEDKVQAALGVPVNFTLTSQAVTGSFAGTGDYERGDYIDDLADLLLRGVRVALIYGDKDYACNWLGGEAVSFSVAAAAQPEYASWYDAGYAPIIVNSSYIGGVVRQFGNLSFSRVYDAGHLVPAYQPETAFTIFTRVIEGTDISTGEPANLTTYISEGDANATHTNSAPSMASPTCYLRAVEATCNTDQQAALANGSGTIINGIWYEKESDWVAPASSVSADAGEPGTPASSAMSTIPASSSVSSMGTGTKTTTAATSTTSLPTGAYVATGTPTMTSIAATRRYGVSWSLYECMILFMSIAGGIV